MSASRRSKAPRLPPNSPNSITSRHPHHITDSEGRFEIEGLVAGLEYHLLATRRKNINARPDVRRLFKPTIKLKPGESRDLGDVALYSNEQTEELRNGAASSKQPNAPKDKTQSSKTQPTTVSGIVTDPDGNPVSGAKVHAVWVFAGDRSLRHIQLSQHFEHEIIAATRSNSSGAFSLTFSNESPDKGRLNGGWHIVATAIGHGPAWKHRRQLKQNASPTLRLARKEDVRGRILDMEGNPISGVRVSVHSLQTATSEQAIAKWIKDAKTKTPPARVEDYFSPSMSGPNTKYPERFPRQWQDGGLALGSPALPSTVESDEFGRFEFRGLGADRLATIQIEGPSIAKTNLLVVTRKMQPLSAMPMDMVGTRSGVYYGREFDFVAESSQLVEGTVTDVDSGEPIVGVQVSLGRFSDSGWSQHDFLSTRTDEKGKYKLSGIPAGGGHRIKVTPELQQPYFQEDKRLLQGSEPFKPIALDFALKQGKWIVGKVTDSQLGKSVSEVNVEYLPLRSNEHAIDYPYYEPQISGQVPSDRYRTDEEGKFRVLAIPGRGILATIARGNDREEFSKLSADQVSAKLIGKRSRLNTYHPSNVTLYNSLIEVEVFDDVDDAQYDLTLTRGGTKLLKFVDDQDRPVTGVYVLGRRANPGLDRPTEDPHVKLIAMRPDEQRLVALIHPEKKIGKVLTITNDVEQTVTLERCAVVHGRFVDSDDQPIPEVEVNVSIHVAANDSWARRLVRSKTDENGRFEALLPAGAKYGVSHYQQKGPRFSAKFDPQPGATYELGDVKDGAKLTAVETAKLMVGAGETKDVGFLNRSA